MPQITQLAQVFASQLFWLAVVFGFIFFVVGRGMLPKVRSTIDARDQQVASDLERAQAARVQAEQTEAEWRERMDEARASANQIARDAASSSARETETQVQEALKVIDRQLEESRRRIRDAVAAARTEIEALAAEAAQEMVQRLTGITVERAEAARAVEAELELIDAGDTQ